MPEQKQCRTCGVELVIGESWAESRVRKGEKLCKACSTADTRERRAGRRKAQRVIRRQADNPIKVCVKCGEILVAGQTWLASDVSTREYICKRCVTARDRKRREDKRERETGSRERKVLWQVDNPIKVCGRCGEILVAGENWTPDKRGRSYTCKKCRSASRRDLGRVYKVAALEKYGGACACCGENRIEFLTIDHINGGGKQDREVNGGVGLGFYRRLFQQPKRDDLRVLCMNCNHAIGMYGYCPHERERVIEESADAFG